MTRPEGFALKLAVSTCTSQQLGKEVVCAVGRKVEVCKLFHPFTLQRHARRRRLPGIEPEQVTTGDVHAVLSQCNFGLLQTVRVLCFHHGKEKIKAVKVVGIKNF